MNAEDVSALRRVATLAKTLNDPTVAGISSESLRGFLNSRPDMLPQLLEILRSQATTTQGRLLASQLIVSADPRTAAELAIDASKDEGDPNTRLGSVRVLEALRPGSDFVEQRLAELTADGELEVRKAAVQALGHWAPAPSGQDGAASLMVLPDDARRDEALGLLDELAHEVHVLIDLGLDETQARIAEELMLPRITALQALLRGVAESDIAVLELRKDGVITLSRVIATAHAFAISVSALASAPGAVATISALAEHLEPTLKILVNLLH